MNVHIPSHHVRPEYNLLLGNTSRLLRAGLFHDITVFSYVF